MKAAVVTACAGALIAVLAYWLNDHGETRRSLRRARADWVGSQLREFYAPLLVLAEANEKAWAEYRRRFMMHVGPNPGGHPLAAPDEARWRTWVETVFAPNARKMQEIITARGDLIIEGEVPVVVLDFCAHATAYDALLSDWEGAGPDKSVLVRHPGSRFLSYVRESHGSLREEQALLLNAARG